MTIKIPPTNKNIKALSDTTPIFTHEAEKFYSTDIYSANEPKTIYYDYRLQECSKDFAVFEVSITTTENDSIITCHISISGVEDKTEYVSQDVIKYERRIIHARETTYASSTSFKGLPTN